MDISTISVGQAVMVSASAVITIGGAWLTLRKIAKDQHKEREHQAAKIIQDAKEADALIKSKLEARIEKLSAEVKNLEFNVNKDMEHLRETYNSEIRNLGIKIEDLRSELRNQTSQIVNLLTQMVNDRN